MSNQRKVLHDLIDEAQEQDLPLLAELVARFQHPLEPRKAARAAPPNSELTRRRQDLISEVHVDARTNHLFREHDARTAKRLGVDPSVIEFGGGSGSIGESDEVEISRHWVKGQAVSRLNTFHLESQEIITFDKAEVSSSGSEIIYKLRVLTAKAESETELNVRL